MQGTDPPVDRSGPSEKDALPKRAGVLWRLVRGLAVGYVGLCVLLFLLQRKLQYFPDASEVPLPAGAAGLRDVTFSTEDGVKLRAWYWSGKLGVTIIVFHGNAGHRGHRLFLMEEFHRLGYGILMLDYRGYGGSEGSPTESGLYLDGEAALSWLADEAPTDRVVYLGESLGSGVAVEMAVRHPSEALIIQSGFASAVDVARRVYPFLPCSWLMKDRYESASKVDRISMPTLFIHGERDRTVPTDSGRQLYELFPEPKEWLGIEGAGHNNLLELGWAQYFGKIDAFLRAQLHLEQEPGGAG